MSERIQRFHDFQVFGSYSLVPRWTHKRFLHFQTVRSCQLFFSICQTSGFWYPERFQDFSGSSCERLVPRSPDARSGISDKAVLPDRPVQHVAPVPLAEVSLSLFCQPWPAFLNGRVCISKERSADRWNSATAVSFAFYFRPCCRDLHKAFAHVSASWQTRSLTWSQREWDRKRIKITVTP